MGVGSGVIRSRRLRSRAISSRVIVSASAGQGPLPVADTFDEPFHATVSDVGDQLVDRTFGGGADDVVGSVDGQQRVG
jgi:hypothetical protein